MRVLSCTFLLRVRILLCMFLLCVHLICMGLFFKYVFFLCTFISQSRVYSVYPCASFHCVLFRLMYVCSSCTWEGHRSSATAPMHRNAKTPLMRSKWKALFSCAHLSRAVYVHGFRCVQKGCAWKGGKIIDKYWQFAILFVVSWHVISMRSYQKTTPWEVKVTLVCFRVFWWFVGGSLICDLFAPLLSFALLLFHAALEGSVSCDAISSNHRMISQKYFDDVTKDKLISIEHFGV